MLDRTASRSRTNSFGSHMKHGFIWRLSLSMLILAGFARPALAERVAREQDIGSLRLGQRIQVDDGTCSAGQIKEVSGTQMTPAGVVWARKCVPRLGPKSR